MDKRDVSLIINKTVLVVVLLATAASGQQPDLSTISQRLKAGQLSDALLAVESALRQEAHNSRLLLLRAKILDELGRSAASIVAYGELLRIHPNMTLALKGLAEVQYRTGNSDAEATLTKVLAADPSDRTAHAMLAVVHFERKRYESAIAHFRVAKPLLDSDPAALWQYAQALLIVRQTKEASAVFRNLLEREPQNTRLRFNLALALHESKDLKESKHTLAPLIDQPKPIIEALSLLASLHLTTGQIGDAIEVLRRAAELYPDNDQPYADLAALCMDRSAFTTGLEILDAGIRNLPTARRLYAIRGAFYAQLGNYDKAQADFARADQDGVAAHSVALQEAGKLDDSIALLRQQIRQHTDDAKLWYLLAEMMLKQGIEPTSPEYPQARQALEKAVQLEPGLLEARVALGKLHLATGDAQAATVEFRQVLAADPNNRTALFKLSQAMRQLGQKEEAAKLSAQVAQMLSQDLRQDSSGAVARTIQRAPARAGAQEQHSAIRSKTGDKQ